MTVSEGVELMTLMPGRVMLYRPAKKRIYCHGRSRFDESREGYYVVTLDDRNEMMPAISDSPLLFGPREVVGEQCGVVFPPPEFISNLPTYYQANLGYPDFDREDVEDLFGRLVSDRDEAREMFHRILNGLEVVE